MSVAYAPRLATAPYSAFRIGAIFVFLLLLAARAFAGQVTLAWDPSPDSGVAGYSLYYGQTSTNLATKIDVGAQTTATATNLAAGTYYFAVKARNAAGTESASSNQVSAVVPVAAPTASFTSNVTAGVAPLAVTFTSTSTGATSYSWKFGDTTTGTGASVSHTYATAGTYTVTLTATGSGGTSTASKTIAVSTVAPPVANFSPPTASGTAPFTVNFTNSSTGATTYSWSFGNGAASSFQNPSYTYTTAGTYTVSLTATNAGGTSTRTGTVTVTPAPAATPAPTGNQAPNGTILSPVANQTIQPGASVSFQGTGSDPDGNTPLSYAWSFGTTPGAPATSTRRSLTRTFTTPGTYVATMTVTDAKGLADPTPATVTIKVAGPAPVAGFSAAPTQGVAPLAVSFSSSASTGVITSWSWNFGDGTSSTAQNPAHTYTAAGTYPVTLTVTGPDGSNTTTRAGYIVVSPPAAAGPTPVPTGLVAAYGFNEGTGTSVNDSSGKGNAGVAANATWATTGRFGRAIRFNGTNSWVTVNDSPSLDLTTGMTLEAWVYPEGSLADWRTILMKEQPGTDVYYIETVAGQAVGDVFVGGTTHHIYSNNAIPLNTWTHLAATYDGASLRLYINGALATSTLPLSGPIQTSNSPLRIGGNSIWGEYFQGVIDEVRVYNRALSAAEITADMSSPLP